jgi:hypothetical protein
MNKLINIAASVLVGMILLTCSATQPTSVLYTDSYDQQTDFTSVTIFPYGVIKVPGKWTKTGESDVSGQHFFVGHDSVKIAIALQPWDEFEFSNNNPQVTPDNFVRKFYEWDANYLKEQTKGQLRIVKENKEKNYLIWNLSSGRKPQDYFLFGLKDKIAYNLSVTTDKWDEEKKIKFLERLYIE